MLKEDDEAMETENEKITVIKNCESKFGQKQMYILSDDGEKTFRSFAVTNEVTNSAGLKSTYLRCVKCSHLRQVESLGGLTKR